MISWPIYVVVGISAVALWKSEARGLRFAAVVVNLAVLDHYCVFLANVGRNTFEHVERREPTADTFREGVFAEAKAADAFAREQLVGVYVVTVCLSGLALWPAMAKRGMKGRSATPHDVQAPLK